MRRNDEGQALAFGAALLVMLAIGMYLIADFGNHVREKIQVQTTADAMAYSLANMEAQSFNFIAFTNRAQVSHYVTMLNLQAWASWASWMEHALILGANVTFYLGIIFGEFQAFSIAMYDAGRAVGAALDAYDTVQDGAIRGLEKLNYTLWVAQMVMANMVWMHLSTGGYEVFKSVRTDPKWEPEMRPNLLLGIWNANKYRDAFSSAGGQPGIGLGLNPGGSNFQWRSKLAADDAYTTPDAETMRLQRAMTEVINATRFDRTLVSRPPVPITGVVEVFSKINEKLNSKMGKVVARTLGTIGLDPQYKAASRLVRGAPQTALPERTLDQIFDYADEDKSKPSTRGQAMASSDEWLWGRGGIWASAVPTGNRAQHCRAKRNASRFENPWRVAFGDHLLVCEDDGKHHWNGISPYMALAAMLPDSNVAQGDRFHQPDVFVWLSKSNTDAGFGKPLRFTWTTTPATQVKFDTSYGRGMGDFAVLGVHATARAQAYYHRPGNWEEPPNLWNPFWHARLMPILPGLNVNESKTPLMDFLKNMMPAIPVVYH